MQTTKENGVVARHQHAPRNTNQEKSFSTSLGQVEQTLTFIYATDRDAWIMCGMTIKSEFGDAGFDEWDWWSACHD
ncbi:MAG: PriCT-2 domain-containing protein [Candidatus Nitrotoga sp.]|nr:PriCT-2 domain-containing protein [Candidatus Nitrotoga sp.]MDP1854733.1 PriCT-2 domain-containing protein [Candidatus Nitrotoga sp.]